MKGKLKKITDKTIQNLLLNEIILPSTYFKSFDQNAKDLSVNIKDQHFEREITVLLEDELKNINAYMQKTVKNIETLTDISDKAQQAITDKDEDKLKSISSALIEMKNEIDSLRDLIYLDSLTKTFNRKWIYNHLINEDGNFTNKGLLLVIDLNDCQYLAEKYGELLADNVIQYVAKFLKTKFTNEEISFAIARYSNNQFLLFIQDEASENISAFLKNIRLELANTTLKSKSGLMFKTSFHFGLVEYTDNQAFQSALEQAAMLSLQEKESLPKAI